VRSELVSITMPEAGIALALYSATLIGVAGYMASRMAHSHRRAVRSLELQAWHLRQLVS
jgi:hypothetical protein